MTLPTDIKEWYALSCPVAGLRFDARTLAFLDADHDGFVRTDEVLAAMEILREAPVEDKVSRDELSKRLDEVRSKLAELERCEPTADDVSAQNTWEAEGAKMEVAVCGEATESAEAALAKVEPVIDAFFTPPDDLPLVTDDPDVVLPLTDHLNPRHLETILDFSSRCVKPVLGERDRLTRLEWKRLKAAFAPYRQWRAAKPVANAGARAALEREEKILCYRLHLPEFLENYVTMGRLYGGEMAIFQTGTLRIDGRELKLCFHVDSEAAHAALAAKSACCVIYLKLTRPASGEERQIGAIVTAGTLAGLYAGRNGVYYDRDGSIWNGVVTRVVESPISLAESFWQPWRKVGDGIAATVKKFLGDRQEKSIVSANRGAASAQAGGAAMASAVAAVGIGIGMVGTAAAAVMAAVSSMTPLRLLLSLAALILVVSLPSVILAWFKVRRRDLGAVLNASGWAINRSMRFTMKRARSFTVCRRASRGFVWLVSLALVLGVILASLLHFHRGEARSCGKDCGSNIQTNEVQHAQK